VFNLRSAYLWKTYPRPAPLPLPLPIPHIPAITIDLLTQLFYPLAIDSNDFHTQIVKFIYFLLCEHLTPTLRSARVIQYCNSSYL